MSKKSDKYGSKQGVDQFESLTDKLVADLRRNIRNMESFPILSDPWIEMTETFGRIASITDVESSLSSGKGESSTLWETEEQALRFMLEDGKLNLCLRSLADFKKSQIQARAATDHIILKFPKECDKFEKGLGSIMKNAWSHVEVLQTTDIPLLVNHIADVLSAVNSMPDIIRPYVCDGDLHQRQEIMVFYYLADIFKHLDEIQEYQVMPLIRERRLFMMGVQALCNYCTIVGNDGTRLLLAHKLKAGEALAALCDTEDFSTYKDQHYSNSDVEVLVELKEICLDELAKDYENKKKLRPLIGVIDAAKRRYGSNISRK